jgi:GMP synthase-like glutamine amidotransferase
MQPMSVNDTSTYPYLAKEKMWIRSFVKSGTPVLGICLGAQLIANAFGGKVYPCNKEKGWREVRRNGTGILDGVPSTFTAFQMRGETFDIPLNGRILCTGDLVRNQAFQIGSATGLQFHPERTGDLIVDWISDLSFQKRHEIAHDTDIYLADSHLWCRAIAEYFFKKIQE